MTAQTKFVAEATDKLWGAHYMNGAASAEGGTEHTGGPVITVSQIELSWAQVWKLLTVLAGAIVAAQAAGYLFIPAKQKDVSELQILVQTIQTGQKQNRDEIAASRDAIARLTLAVDNLSGIVDQVRQTATQRSANDAEGGGRRGPVARPRATTPKPQTQGLGGLF